MNPSTQHTGRPETRIGAREFYDRAAASYDAEMDTEINLSVRRRVKELLARYSQGDGAVLDFGCGTGGDVAGFLEQGRRVLAYDPSAGMLARARERHGEAVRQQRVVLVGGEVGDLYAAISNFEPIRAVVANFGVINLLPDLAPFTDLVMRRLTSLQTVILGVVNPFYLPDMRSGWWWRGLWEGRSEGAILCGQNAPRTHRYFPSILTAALSPVFRLRESYHTWDPIRLLAFERLTQSARP